MSPTILSSSGGKGSAPGRSTKVPTEWVKNYSELLAKVDTSMRSHFMDSGGQANSRFANQLDPYMGAANSTLKSISRKATFDGDLSMVRADLVKVIRPFVEVQNRDGTTYTNVYSLGAVHESIHCAIDYLEGTDLHSEHHRSPQAAFEFMLKGSLVPTTGNAGRRLPKTNDVETRTLQPKETLRLFYTVTHDLDDTLQNRDSEDLYNKRAAAMRVSELTYQGLNELLSRTRQPVPRSSK